MKFVRAQKQKNDLFFLSPAIDYFELDVVYFFREGKQHDCIEKKKKINEIKLSLVVHVVFPNFLIDFDQKFCLSRNELKRQLYVCKHRFLNLSDSCTSLIMSLIDQNTIIECFPWNFCNHEDELLLLDGIIYKCSYQCKMERFFKTISVLTFLFQY